MILYSLRIIRNLYRRFRGAAMPNSEQVNFVQESALFLKFALRLLFALPVAILWYVTRHIKYKAILKRKLIQQEARIVDHFDTSLFAQTGAPPHAFDGKKSATVIMPVYNAFDDLQECLFRLENRTDIEIYLIIIEDCSSDPAIRPFLRNWVADRLGKMKINLIENQSNLGFVKSVNKGLSLARTMGNHVILLNTDAMVPQQWASRMLRPFEIDPMVASVTPLSNNAEILSVPTICVAAELREGEVDYLDAALKNNVPEPVLVDLPTGVGFCLAMNISFVQQLELLDTKFGHGYGEEVDWCLRAVKAGGRNVGHTGLFVQHRGGKSFGEALKSELLFSSGQIISKRYPEFNNAVHKFIENDPISSYRVLLTFALVSARTSQNGCPIYFAHSLGGGAEMFLEQKKQEDIDAVGYLIIVRSGADKARWFVEVIGQEFAKSFYVDDEEVLMKLLSLIEKRKLIYSCAVGDKNMMDIPRIITSLKKTPVDELHVLVHDYLMLSPSYTLLTSNGVYKGVPFADDTDSAHQYIDDFGTRYSLEEWQDSWMSLAIAADRIHAFSNSSKQILVQRWAEHESKIFVLGHKPLFNIQPLPAKIKPTRPVVGILGNIGFQKGAGILHALSLIQNDWEGSFEFVILGDIAPEFDPGEAIHVHGNYKHEEIIPLVKTYGINIWLIPSIWPETFSYVTHEAIATGLPVCCFDLGAQAEAVEAAPNGFVLKSDCSETEVLLNELKHCFDAYYSRAEVADAHGEQNV